MLSKKRPRSAYVEQTVAEGTQFGGFVQAYVEGTPLVEPAELNEQFEAFREFRRGFPVPPGARCEVAIGLFWDGSPAHVVEIYPHYYVTAHHAQSGAPYFLPAAGPGPQDGVLATAGRNDVCWVNGNVAIVLDMKRSAFRYCEPERVPQLMALGCMWALANELEFFQTGLYGLRDNTYQWAQEIQCVSDVLPEVLRMAAIPEDTPIPGEHCQSCYERRQCPPGLALYPIKKRTYTRKKA